MATSLESLLSSVNDMGRQLNTVATIVQDVGRDAANLAESNADIYQMIGNNESISIGAKGASELQIQQARLKAAAINGTDLSSNAEEMSALTEQLNIARTIQMQGREAINAKRAVGIGDNPLQWLVNQFTINDDIARYNSAEATGNDIARRIQEKNSLTQTQIVTQNSLSTGITAATIQAEQEKVRGLATINANKAKIEGAQYNADGILKALNLSRDFLGLQFQANAAINSEKNMQIALANLEMQRKRFEQQVKDEKVEESFILDSINAGMKLRLGPNTPSLPERDAKFAIQMVKSGKPSQFMVDMITGQEYLSTGIKRYANSPSEALNIFSSNIRYNLPPAMEPLKEVLAQAARNVQRGSDGKPFDPKDVQGNIAKVNAEANRLLTAANREVTPGTNNPFNIPSLSTLIKHSPAVASSPVVTKVFAPQLQAGVDLSTPEKQFAAIVEAVKTNKLTIQEALDATTIYQVGVRTNLEERQFHALGFSAPGDGSWFRYNAKIQTDPDALFSRTEVVDLTKPDLFSRALMKNLMAQRKSEGFQRPAGLGLTN